MEPVKTGIMFYSKIIYKVKAVLEILLSGKKSTPFSQDSRFKGSIGL